MLCQVLDAPGLADDFYVSLLDWSQQGLLAVALGTHIYVYNTVTSKVGFQCLVLVKPGRISSNV